jgi:hypothetical protein
MLQNALVKQMINPNSLMGKAFQKTERLLLDTTRVPEVGHRGPRNYIDLTSRSSISESPTYSQDGTVRHRSQYHREGNTFINTVAYPGAAPLGGGQPVTDNIWIVHDFNIATDNADTTWTVRRWWFQEGRLVANGDGDTGYLDHGRYGREAVECTTGNCFYTVSPNPICGLSGGDC